MADATQVQRRRGTQSQCDAGTPVEGEIWVDTTLDTLRVGDGVKSGGYLMPNAEHIQENTFTYGQATGTNNLSINLYPVPDTPTHGFSFKFRASDNNTGSVNISVNGASPIEVRKIQGASIVPLVENDIIGSGIYEVNHNGVYYLLNSQIPSTSNDYQFVGRFTPPGNSQFWNLINIFEQGYNYDLDFVGIGQTGSALSQINRVQFSTDGGSNWITNYLTQNGGSEDITLGSVANAVQSDPLRGFYCKFELNDPARSGIRRIHARKISFIFISSASFLPEMQFNMGQSNSVVGVNSMRLISGNNSRHWAYGYINIWRKRTS